MSTISITYVNKGAFASSSGSITVSLPSGIQAGDLLLIFAESENQSISFSTANGWENLLSELGTGTAAADTSTRLAVFWKIATSSETAPILADPGDHIGAIMAAWRGVDNTTPFDATYQAAIFASGETMTFPSITTATNGAMIVNATSLNRDLANTANLSSWTNASLESITEGHDQTAISSGGGGIGFAYGIKATAGDVNQTSVTVAATENAQPHSTITIALKEAGSSGSESHSGTVSISASSSVAATGKKGASSQVITSAESVVVVTGKANKKGSAVISATYDIETFGKKSASGLILIEQSSLVQVTGSQDETISKYGTVSITQESTIEVTGQKGSGGTITIAIGSSADYAIFVKINGQWVPCKIHQKSDKWEG